MLHEVSTVHQLMDADGQRRVLRRVEMSGALPVSRDTPSYAALLGILWGGGGKSRGVGEGGRGGGGREKR